MSAPRPDAAEGARRSRRGVVALTLVAALAAAALLLPALGAHGIWDDGEAMVLSRARAALGVPMSDLIRAPWLPDALRTAALRALDAPEAIRLPGALATLGLVGLTALIAAARGVGSLAALIAGGFALTFPLTQAQGRLALGDPIGELFAAVAAIAGYLSLRLRGWRALAMGFAAALALALATASAGLILGALIPLVAIAVGRPTAPRGGVRWAVRGLWLAIVAVAAAAAALVWGQGDGYIPLLGAAKDLALQERPHSRGFAASLRELGLQLYPWLPLALIGVLRPGKMRWPALWLLSGLGVHTIASLVYGPSALPLTIPAALCCTAGLIHLADPTTHRQLRRLALLLAIGGVLVVGKDAGHNPTQAAAVLAPPANADLLPAAAIGADVLLGRLSKLAILMIVVAGVAGGRRIAKPWLAPGVAAAILLYQALSLGHGLIPRISTKRSLKAPLTRFAAWASAGELAPQLGVGRIRSPGLAVYGPPADARAPTVTRAELIAFLRRPEPRAALIRDSDLPALFAAHRSDDWPLFVLDASHANVLLVANALPAGADERNPLLEVVADTPPALAHETLVRFDDYIEVVGWELQDPLVRGEEATATVALRVLRPLPGGAQLYLRLQRGKLSRISAEPQPFTQGLYPPNHWRPGDYIIHRHRVDVPLLEIVSGTHEVIVGIRRSPKKNLEISEPSEARGAYGVEVKGNTREFAAIGEVKVW
ncbi:MAG: hypothetical protein R3A79_13255 [Nannocystaceae bacterium]